MRSDIAIEINHISKFYPHPSEPVSALVDVHLAIPAGQFVCVLGPSGSGKSTLLRILAGLESPDRGTAHIAGTEVTQLSRNEAALFRRKQLGIIFQFFNLMPMLSVEENVALPLLLAGSQLADLQPKITLLLDRLKLSHRRYSTLDRLSGGEIQRAAIARALLIQPTVLLADEPTGNLDSKLGHQVFQDLRSLSQQDGIAILLMTHDLRAVSYADRVISLKDGRIVSDTISTAPVDIVDPAS